MSVLLGILNTLVIVISLFLVCVVLIQRGRGGGLAGAFGGVGGSSAFGTKAGDIFTKITIGVASAWMAVLMLLVVLTNGAHQSAYTDEPTTSETKTIAPGGKAKAKTNATDAGTGRAAGDMLTPPPLDSLAPPPPPPSPAPTPAPAPASKPAANANAKAPSPADAKPAAPSAPSAPVKAPAIPEKK